MSFNPQKSKKTYPTLLWDFIRFQGQLLRFGEHNIKLLRKELHAAVDEETRFEGTQKDIRKQLLDKVFELFQLFF